MVKKILLAESDPFLTGVYANQLRQAGFAISIAPDGEIALGRAKSMNPDVLILNDVLPKMSGIEVLRLLRQDQKFEGLKVIMLSNFLRGQNLEDIEELGILKNFSKAETTSEEIANEIKKILS